MNTLWYILNNLKQESVNNIVSKAKKLKAAMIYVSYNEPSRISGPADIYVTGVPEKYDKDNVKIPQEMQELAERMKVAFQERPIWSKLALAAHLRADEKKLSSYQRP